MRYELLSGLSTRYAPLVPLAPTTRQVVFPDFAPIAAGTPIVLAVAIDKPPLSGWKSIKANAGASGVFVRHDRSFVQTRAGVDREVVIDVIEIDGRRCKLARQWFTVAG